MAYQAIDYRCAGCGAQAVSVPCEPGDWGSRVLVPHELGCPVAIRVAETRTRAALAGKR